MYLRDIDNFLLKLKGYRTVATMFLYGHFRFQMDAPNCLSDYDSFSDPMDDPFS